MVVQHHAHDDYLASFWTLNTEATPESPLQHMFSVSVVLPASLRSPTVSFSLCVAFKDCFDGESTCTSHHVCPNHFSLRLRTSSINGVCSMTQILMSYLDSYKQFSMIMSRTVFAACCPRSLCHCLMTSSIAILPVAFIF